jgi:hypothetical protein
MDSGNDGAMDAQVRYPRSRRWLQFYVDLFMTNCPRHCKNLSVTVVSDLERSNGCNWQLSVLAPEGKADLTHPCLQHIESDLQLLFSTFDLDEEREESRNPLRQRRA